MALLENIFGGNLGTLFKDIVGTFKLSPAAKQEFQEQQEANAQAIRLKEMELEAKAMEQTQSIVDAQKSIIVAEMAQGDAYTKRARPSVVYAGLGFIFLVHVFLPMIAFFTNKPMPTLALPPEFWAAWGAVISIWSIGRSMERRGAVNKVTSTITGSNQPTDLNILTLMAGKK